MSSRPHAGPAELCGVFLVSGAALLFELGLTRLYSATMGYHLAFVAISVALLGTAAAAVLIDSRPDWFPIDLVRRRMAQGAVGFAVSALLAYRIGAALPLTVQLSLFDPKLMGIVPISGVSPRATPTGETPIMFIWTKPLRGSFGVVHSE
jgi:hypothetical protein